MSDTQTTDVVVDVATPDALPPVADVMQSIADTEAAAAAEAEAAADASLTLDEAVERITDGSRLAEGTTWNGIVDAVRYAAIGVVTLIVSLTKVRYEAAKVYGQALSSILLVNGVPDWGGKSESAKILRKYALDAAMEKLGDATQNERDKERNAISKQYERNVRDFLIRKYVVENTVREVVAEDGTVTTVRLFTEADDTNDLFLAYCRAQYRDSGIGTLRAMPGKYRNEEDRAALTASTGGPGQGTSSALKVAGDGIDALAGTDKQAAVAVQYRVTLLLKGMTSLVRDYEAHKLELHGKGDVVAEVAARIGTLGDYLQKCISYPEVVTAEVAEDAATSMYDADRDNPDRADSIWA